MIERVRATIISHSMISPMDTVLVGVSGGADSMCLLYMLWLLKEELLIKLHAVHINHMLRGAEADEDELYVNNWCHKLEVPITSIKVDVGGIARETGVSVEEAGRNVRYREFDRVCKQLYQKAGTPQASIKIAVAHHAGDVAETMMINLIRGAGIDGLAGISPKRGNVIRPLIELEKNEIVEFCEQNGISPRIDMSNFDTVYTRNKIRQELFPYLQSKFNPSIINTLTKAAKLLSIDARYMDEQAQEAFRQCSEVDLFGKSIVVKISIPKLGKLHEAISTRVIRLGIEKVKHDLKGISHVHVKDILKLIALSQTGSCVQLPAGIRAEKAYNVLKIYRIMLVQDKPDDLGVKISRGQANSFEYYFDFCDSDILKLEVIEAKKCVEARILHIDDYKHIQLEKKQIMKEDIQIFDYDKLRLGIYLEKLKHEQICAAANDRILTIRNRREGDIFSPSGMKGSKKLKSFFIDQKIPREERRHKILLAVGSEILWVIGYRASGRYGIDENTKKVLVVKVYDCDNSLHFWGNYI